MSREPRAPRASRPILVLTVLALSLAPRLAVADGGVPLAEVPGVPRIVMRSQVEAAAANADIRLPPGPIENYRITWDGGEAVSLGAPERVGTDAIRFLYARPEGSVALETMPLSRVRTIGTPPKTALAGETFSGLLLAGTLPLMVSSVNPVHFFAGLGIWGMPFSRMPEFRTLSAPDYFNRPGAWTGSVSATVNGIRRTSVNFSDQRRESVPSWKLEVDAGSRRSAAAFVLSVRMLSMTRPFTRDPSIYPEAPNENIPKYDSLYRGRSTAYTLSPGLRLTWAETDRFTIFSQTGIFFSLTPYWRDTYPERSEGSAGSEFGGGFDWWLTKSIGVRGEGALLVPMNSDWDFSYEPSLGAGLVYRYEPRHPVSFQVPVTLTLMAAGSSASFGHEERIEADDGPHRSAGIGTRVLESSASPSGSTTFYPEITKGRFEQVQLFISYGIHGDRARRAFAGVQFLAGLESVSHNIGTRSVYDTTVYVSSRWDKSTHPILEILPEAGLRLGYGFGLRLQWRILSLLPAIEPTPSAFAAGFTYTLPGIGERK